MSENMKTEQKIIDQAREYEKEVYQRSGISRGFWYSYVRPAIYAKYNYQCCECGSSRYLDVHHLRYGMDITLEDLILLCRSCHRTLHNAKENTRTN